MQIKALFGVTLLQPQFIKETRPDPMSYTEGAIELDLVSSGLDSSRHYSCLHTSILIQGPRCCWMSRMRILRSCARGRFIKR